MLPFFCSYVSFWDLIFGVMINFRTACGFRMPKTSEGLQGDIYELEYIRFTEWLSKKTSHKQQSCRKQQ